MRKILSKLLQPLINFSFDTIIFLVNQVYKYDSFRRCYVLEKIARIPYFAYLSCLHLYQSLGFHPGLKLMNLHYKENINEEYHLLIMESLGGRKYWYDHFLASLLAVLYYFLNVFFYIIAPGSDYYLMQKVEREAVHSYNQILKIREHEFKNKPAWGVMLEYYYSQDGRMTPPPDKTESVSLYQIFESIRNDEEIHIKDMNTCERMPSLYTFTPGIEL